MQNNPFGQIEPPPGSKFAAGPNPLGNLLVVGIKVFLIAAAITALIYLLWGGLDWITSGGDKERVAKAQSRIQNAIIGIFLVIVALVLFGFITGDILGIIERTDRGWEFNIPTLQEGGGPGGPPGRIR